MLDVAKIATLREAAGLSQTEAAKRAGMSVQQWHNIESGRVGQERGLTLSTLQKIARALDCSIEDLLGKLKELAKVKDRKPGRPAKVEPEKPRARRAGRASPQGIRVHRGGSPG